MAHRLLLLLALAASADAQTCTTSWAAPVSGSYTDSGNWTNGVPVDGSTACIQQSGTYTVALSQNRALGALVLGGASGTQTLALSALLTTLGSGTVGPNGRVEISPIQNAGIPVVSGTLTVEGVVALPIFGRLLSTSGTLDIAPGGLLRATEGVRVGADAGAATTVRVRGRFEAEFSEASTGPSVVYGSLEVDGGTVATSGGNANPNNAALQLNSGGGGRLRNATFEVAAGTSVILSSGIPVSPAINGVFVAEGTMRGVVQGSLTFTSGSSLRAGPADATLSVGGTGVLFQSNGFGVPIAGGGGAFRNMGLVRFNSGVRIAQVVFRNEGTMRLENTQIIPVEGAVVRNAAVGTIELLDGAAISEGDRTGRVENAGLLVTRLATSTTPRVSGLGGRLRSLGGSELRVGAMTRLDLDAPGSASLPAGVRVTGDGTLFIGSTEFFIEGEVSPGTEAQPVATLGVQGRFYVSRLAGSPRLVIDVDAGGVSDQVAFAGTGGVNFPIRPAGTLVVRVRPGYVPQIGDTFTILTGSGASEIQGEFAQVVAQDAPAGIAFIAEYDNTGTSAIRVRAVAVAPDGPVTVSDTAPIGGNVRPIFLTGPGAPGIASARLDCRECLDPVAFGTIPAVLMGEGTLKEARFDLTSPRAWGFYDLVVQRPGQPDVAVPFTVRPFLSYIVTTAGLTRGIGVRPSDLQYNWSALSVHNVTNADEPGYTVAAFNRQDPDQVALAFAAVNTFRGNRAFEERAPGDARPILAFGRVTSDGPTPLSYGQRIDPSEVLFPEQTRTGAADRRIPFGERRTVLSAGVQHASFARMRALVADALRATDDAELAAYLSGLDASDPEVVSRSVGVVIYRRLAYVEGPASLLTRLVAELDRNVPAPSGLAAGAALAFETALNAAAGRHFVESYQAVNLDSQAAPASVRALLDAEVVALGGDEAGGTARQRPEAGPGGVCSPPGGPPDASPSDTALAQALALAAEQARQNRERQTIDAIQNTTRASHDNCAAVINSTKRRRGGSKEAGSCDLPPLPPGGPPGGGGGSCGPPAAPADPNDKTANSQYHCEIGTVTIDGQEVTRCVRYYVPLADAAEPIVYSVQFENLPQATANAEFVTVTDVLDPSLDPATLQVIATSADSVFSVTTSGQTVTFRFTGIDLPPNVDEPEGQGFVTFSVEPRAGLSEGTEIRNDAEIVFDFNPPISTPEVVHVLRRSADLAAVIQAEDFADIGASSQAEVSIVNLAGDAVSDARLTITLPVGVTATAGAPVQGKCSGSGPVVCTIGDLVASELVTVSLTLSGTSVGTGEIRATASTAAFDAFAPNDTDLVAFGVTPVGAEDDGPGAVTLSAWPNPVRGTASLRWALPSAGRVDLRVFDLLGREVAVLADDEPAEAGAHVTPWAAEVASGVYVVRLRSGDVTRTRRLVVVR